MALPVEVFQVINFFGDLFQLKPQEARDVVMIMDLLRLRVLVQSLVDDVPIQDVDQSRLDAFHSCSPALVGSKDGHIPQNNSAAKLCHLFAPFQHFHFPQVHNEHFKAHFTLLHQRHARIVQPGLQVLAGVLHEGSLHLGEARQVAEGVGVARQILHLLQVLEQWVLLKPSFHVHQGVEGQARQEQHRGILCAVAPMAPQLADAQHAHVSAYASRRNFTEDYGRCRWVA
mmetsp:Transcript_30115/g.71710  ORF Transcript_30115/g.71710 Transcript_30115/m.71710 type:complete len:229 (-) Transcript_30115:299-985(-)